MKKLLIAFISLVASICSAQMVTVTGTIQSIGGVLATSGYVQFNLEPVSANVLYYIVGTGVLAPTSFKCGIDGTGNVRNIALSGPCQVWGINQISPANLAYVAVLAPNNVITNTVHKLQIISPGPFNLNNPSFVPTISVVPQSANVTTFPYGTNVIPSAAHALTVGSALAPYAAGYFDNLFINGNKFDGAGVASWNARVGDVVPLSGDYNFNQLNGNWLPNQYNSGTGASSSTFARGDGIWAIPTGSLAIYINVKDPPYNCFGDGTHDDTVCIQNAIDAAEAATFPTSLFFPAGFYIAGCSAPIRIHKQGVGLIGVNRVDSTIGPKNAVPCNGLNGVWLINAETGTSLNTGVINYNAAALLTGGTKAFQVTQNDYGSGWLDFKDCSTCPSLNGLSAFTAESTIKPTNISANNFSAIITSAGARDSFVTNNKAFQIYIQPNGTLTGVFTSTAGSATINSGSGAIVVNTQYHVALSWDGGTVRLFINGNSVGTPVALGGTMKQDLTEAIHVGCDPSNHFPDGPCNNSQYRSMTGTWDGIRLSSNARYTSNFTPPTSKFGAPDTATIIQCNFTQQYDIATQCDVNNPNQETFIPVHRIDFCPGGINQTNFQHLGFNKGGVFVNLGAGVDIKDIYMQNTDTTGLNIGYGCNFESHIEDAFFQASNNSRYELNVGTGIARLNRISLNGGYAYGLTTFSAVNINDVFIQITSFTIAPTIVRGGSGSANYARITDYSVDSEAAAANMVATLIIDTIYAGNVTDGFFDTSFEANTVFPIIVNGFNDQTKLRFSGNIFNVPTGLAALVHYNSLTTFDQTYNNPLSFENNTFIGVNSVPFSDAPAQMIRDQMYSGVNMPYGVNLTNDTTTGTFPTTPTKITSTGKGIVAPAASTGGVLGIASLLDTHQGINSYGVGKVGSTDIAVFGISKCIFDNGTTAGDYVQMSGTTNSCHDAGAGRPGANQIFGVVLDTGAVISPASVTFFSLSYGTGGSMTAGTYHYAYTFVSYGGGESAPSGDNTFVCTANSCRAVFSAPANFLAGSHLPDGVAGFRLYVGTNGGGIGTETLQPSSAPVCTPFGNLANSPLLGCGQSSGYTLDSIFAGTAPPGASAVGPLARVALLGTL